jgi:hypothetical protein
MGGVAEELRDGSRARRWAAGASAVVLLGVVGAVTVVAIADDDEPNISTTRGPDGAGAVAQGADGRVYGYGSVLPIECGQSGFVMSGSEVGGPLQCEPLEPLFNRDGDVVVRAYQTPEQPDAGFCGAEGTCPPPECFPSRYVVAGLSTPEAVGTARGPRYVDALGPIVAAHGFFGVGEGFPVAWAVTQVGPEVARVRVSFAAGGADEMEPKDGVAVLASAVAAAGPGVVPPAGGTVQALDAGGGVIATGELPTNRPVEDVVLSDPACAPRPPELPEPHGPPPADQEAARADIDAAFATLYNRSLPEEERGTRLDDNRGVKQAVEQVERNYPGALEQQATIRVDEVRFLSPTEAAVRYAILLPGYSTPEFPNRTGRAVLIDGVWKVTRDTLCADLALGGGECGA